MKLAISKQNIYIQDKNGTDSYVIGYPRGVVSLYKFVLDCLTWEKK